MDHDVRELEMSLLRLPKKKNRNVRHGTLLFRIPCVCASGPTDTHRDTHRDTDTGTGADIYTNTDTDTHIHPPKPRI